MKRLTQPTYSFDEKDAQKAHEEWGANCGPNALAAILGLSLEDVRKVIPKFEDRRYTSPKMMKDALLNLGVTWHDRVPVAEDYSNHLIAGIAAKPKDSFRPHILTRYGLVRIQIEGPWYGRFAYHHTHWIASAEFDRSDTRLWIFDCNQGWSGFDHWNTITMPEVCKLSGKRATGQWSATHRWELEI